MPAMPSITIIKEFTYRGAREEWSNTYNFSGPVPADNQAWLELGNAIWTAEKPSLIPDVKVVQYYGYVGGTVASVAQIDRRLEPEAARSGTAAVAAGDKLAGDQAVMLRALVGNSVKGKKVYIRKYFHGCPGGAGDADLVVGTVTNTLNTLGDKLLDGTLPGGRKWCSPSGRVAIQPSVSPFVTTRTLKRRGRRPLAP
jgi:hypothetical protein